MSFFCWTTQNNMRIDFKTAPKNSDHEPKNGEQMVLMLKNEIISNN